MKDRVLRIGTVLCVVLAAGWCPVAARAGTDYADSELFTVDTRGGSGVSADSGLFAVDTRTGDRPVVADVRSSYCDRLQHVYFVRGVPMTVEFTADVDWNGRPPGTIRFETPQGSDPGESRTRAYDVGAWPAGGQLAVVAISADGTQSWPCEARFDVVNPPPGIPSDMLVVVPVSAGLKYSTGSIGLDWDLFNEGVDSVPADDDGEEIPGFGGKALKFASSVKASANVLGAGTASATLSVAPASKLKLAGLELDPRIYGRPEWTYDPASGTWTMGGYLGFGVSTKTKIPPPPIPPPYIWAVPPIYVRGELEAALAVELGIDDWSPSGYPVMNGRLPIEASAFFVAGCGAADVLAVEGYIGGGPVLTLQFPQEPTLEELGIHLEGGVRVVVLVFEYDLGLLDYTWWLVGGEEGQGTGVLALQPTADLVARLNDPDPSDFRLMPRSYLATPTRMLGTFDARGSTRETSASDCVAVNTFPYSEPALVVNGEDRLLLWVMDDPGRLPENRTELVWQQGSGGTWSAATAVWDDGTGDSSPQMAMLADGSAIATWQNGGTALPSDAGLEDALADLEIASAVFSPVTETWDALNLTSNSVLDRSPQLSVAADGTALLAWVRNDDLHHLGNAAEPNAIRYSVWDGGSWSTPADMATGLGMMPWTSVAWNGTTGVLVAVLDGDDDQTTIDDQDLFAATFDGVVWSALTQVTADTVQDTRPQVVYDAAGELLLAWYRDGYILTDTDLSLGDAVVVGESGASLMAKDFRLVTGPAGQVSMVWERESGTGSMPDPYLLQYDPALDLWSDPVALFEDDLLEHSFSGAYSASGGLVLAYNRVEVGDSTEVASRFGQTDLCVLEHLVGVDLAVAGNEITIPTGDPVPGSTVDVSVVVHNLGENAADGVEVDLYDGDPSGDGQKIGTVALTHPLAGGTSDTVAFAWEIPESIEPRALYAVVDPSLAVEDRDRSNNAATLSVLAPDLDLQEVFVGRPVPGTRLITARIQNAGVVPSDGGTEVAIRLGAVDGPRLHMATLDAMAADTRYDLGWEWDLAGATSTSAFDVVYVVVDEAGTVTESAEDNNVLSAIFMTNLDSDGDGLLDGEEERLGTLILVEDTDGDGLTDGDEVNLYGTDPTAWDTDGDRAGDGDEMAAGTDPLAVGDVFAVVEGSDLGGILSLTWNAKEGRTYQVLRSTDLPAWEDAPSGSAPEEQSHQVAAADGQLEYRTSFSAEAKCFYRVVTWQ